MHFDPERVRLNIQQATTEDLLDRMTVYRKGMEPEALEMVEAELAERGVDGAAIQAHAQQRDAVLMHPDGVARSCTFCRRPAVAEEWGWHCLLKVIPIFPRLYAYCDKHDAERRGITSELSSHLPE